MVKMFLPLLLLFVLDTTLDASAVANFVKPENNNGVVFLMTTPKSGSNVVSGCLLAITRKPISWFQWGGKVLDPNSAFRKDPSYNRLGLPLVSDYPLLYRAHYEIKQLKRVPSERNTLIFVTRNPKELLYRSFFLQQTGASDPDPEYITKFLQTCLDNFWLYEQWHQETRMLVFYEDFIEHSDEILLEILEFIQEPPVFLEDYLDHKEDYLARLLDSYATQHVSNRGGSSSRDGPKAIYYTRDASPDVLRWVDQYLKDKAPDVWEKYLKRFETTTP